MSNPGPAWSVARVARGVGRRIPLRPLVPLAPFRATRPLLRLWLAVLRAHPDPAKALRHLLLAVEDANAAMDRAAIAYDRGVHPKHRLTGYHDFFVERIRGDETVLDVGCGIGTVAHDIAVRTGADVIAIDTSPWSLAFARQRFAHPRLEFVEGDALTYLPPRPVDVAVLSNVLEHIDPRVELLRSLGETAGARRLLVRVPAIDRDWSVPLRQELGLPHFSDPTHELEYTPAILTDELRTAGWTMGEPTLSWGEIWVEARRAD